MTYGHRDFFAPLFVSVYSIYIINGKNIGHRGYFRDIIFIEYFINKHILKVHNIN